MVSFAVGVAHKVWMSNLQLEIKALQGWLAMVFWAVTKSVTTLASSSMWSFLILRFLANVRPSLNPQSSAAREWVKPMFLEKPPIQLPLWSLIRPPAPAMPGLLLVEPSILSLKKPMGGGFHPTEITLQCHFRVRRGSVMKSSMDKGWIFLRMSSGEKGLLSMTNLFLASRLLK